MAKKQRGHGEGSIHRLPSGSWRTQLYIDGKRHGKTFTKKTDAQRWLRKMQDQLDMGYDMEGRDLTIGEYLPQWLENSNG